MADNILKLRVESSEYDAKLKKAAEGIRHLAEVAHKGGGELTGLEKAELDYIKSLGTMETKSRTAAGSVRELENTFKELTVVYNQLNDVEKQDEGGKALAASLDKLKERAQAARAELDNASKALGNTKQAEVDTKGGLEGLTSALGINIKTLAGWGSAIAAGKVALDVAKDAFLSSESNVDEWGRTVAASQSLYESFVASLNTGDFSGFFTNIDNITKAAKEAYDALDELGTRMTIINPERAKLQARQQELRATIRTKGADSTEGKKASAELKKLQSQLSKTYSSESTMNRNAFEKLVRQRMTEGGVNLDERSFREFMKTFDSDANFQQFRKRAKGGIKTIQSSSSGTSSSGAVQTYSRTVDTRNTEKKLMDIFTDEWRKNNSGYLTASYMAQGAAASNALGNARYLREKASGTGGTGGKPGKTTKTDIQYADDSIMAQEKLVSDLTQKWKTASGELRDGYLKDLEEAQKKLDEMTGKAKGDGAPTFTMAQLEGMSFGNQIPATRGNNGRAQDKLDLATAAFATGGTSNVDFSNYISGIKNALSNANLGDELYNNMTEKLKDATTVSTLLQEMMERGLAGADFESTAQALKEKLLSPDGIDQTAVQSFLEELNKKIEEAGGVPLKLNADTGEVTDDKDKRKDERDRNRFLKKDDDGKYEAKMTDIMSGMAGGISNVVSGLNTLGVEIPAGLQSVLGGMQAISSILSGIAVTVMAIEAISGADAIIPFAHGGIVPAFAQGGLIGRAAGGLMIPGNSMSGDRLRLPVDGGRGMIGVNSGELILNRAQQGNLASQLEGGGMENLQLDTVIGAEDIRVVMNNRGRRTGRGEFVQSRKYNG